jgi:hypothetical protein
MKHVVLDDDMSRQRDFVGEDVVVADHAVVRHVTADHEKVARADARRFTFAARPMQRAKLANHVVVADFEITLLAAKFHVLRLAAHDGMLENRFLAPIWYIA